MNKEKKYIQNSINEIVDEFMKEMSLNYNPDWKMNYERYLNLVRDRVNKQLHEEMMRLKDTI